MMKRKPAPKKKTVKGKAPAPKVKAKAKPTKNKPQPTPAPMSPEASGWIKIQEWPGLFVLYRRGSEHLAELQPELEANEKRLMSGHGLEDLASAKLDRAWGLLAFLEFARRDSATNHNSWGFLELRREAIGLLTETLGELALKLFYSSREAAENSYMDMVALVKRTGEGIVKRRFDPIRYKGKWALPVLAIYYAKLLCEQHGRLPSKAEVKERLMAPSLVAMKLGFSKKSNAHKGNWNQVFDRAGLGGLPDTPL
jgi:hypothetical protein